jgi:BirA family biotin operon repressor/biotin-[acetyl-CoA-carboxylase] ligase
MTENKITDLPFSWDYVELEEVGSTNLYAVEAIKEGKITENCVISAKEQTAGRGRLGRVWESERGNLFSSIIIKIKDKPTKDLGQLSFVSSLSLAEAIEDFNPNVNVECKWPNDVLLNSKKTAGILLEVVETKQACFVVIGTGVNIVDAPNDIELYKATCLNFENINVDKEDLLKAYIKHLTYNLSVWQKTGFENIRQWWLEYAIGIGKRITVTLKEKEFEGIFKSLSKEGALILEKEDGTVKTIVSGEVFFD